MSNEINHALVAACWTSAGDSAPLRGDGTSPIDIATRVEAVAGTGWTGMGIVHADLVRARDTIGLHGLKDLLAEHGLAICELEFIRDWWTTGARRAASDRVRHDLLEAAGELGAKTIKAGAKNGGDPVDRDRFLSAYDQLATEAHSAGARIALEATASSDVLPTLRHAVDVVQAVGNPCGGVCVDVWHTSRSGTDHSELAGMLSPEIIFAAELSDGGAHAPASIWDDETNHRRLPGDGAFDVADFVVALHELGYRGHWGVEIMSEEHRRLPVRTALQRAYAKSVTVLDGAQAQLTRARPGTPR